jgi:hypothetical protein
MYEEPDIDGYSLFVGSSGEPQATRNWKRVDTFEAFKETIRSKGPPNTLSMGMDLKGTKNGMDCAWWLVEQATQGRVDLTEVRFECHSDDPEACQQTVGLLVSCAVDQEVS